MITRAFQPTKADASFLPSTSHEIESLINAILAASQSLSDMINSPNVQNEHAIRELVQLIRCSGLSIAPFINELVTIGKRQANSEEISLRAVYNFQQELEYIRDAFTYEALAKNIDISISIQGEIPVVFCDIDNLRIHVFNNLLANAIRHTPIGGKIAIRAEIKDNRMLIIKISDTGLGILASERERVFRKHLRLDQYRNTVRGSGLHNALQSVLAHKGKISLVDEPDFTGATFQIETPLHAGCIQKVTAQSSPSKLCEAQL